MPAIPVSSPLDILWRPHAVMSIIMVGEGLALVLTLSPNATGDPWVFFGLASLTVQWVGLLAVGGLYAMRGLLAKRPVQHTAWVAVPLMVLSVWLVSAIAWLALRGIWPLTNAAWLALVWRMTAIALIVGFLGLAALQNYWLARQLAVRVKQAELEALQARVRPHFLFNTLNTATALVHARPSDAEQLLLDLSDLFRAALSGPSDILLADELTLARRYLEIESLRFGDRLRVHWVVPADLPAVKVPALSIQPLVENAVRHGIEPSSAGGDLDILLETSQQSLTVTIRNDLPDQGGKAISGHQIGVASVRERFRALGGSLDTRIENGRYVAVVAMPLPADAWKGPGDAQVSTRKHGL